MNDFGHDRVGAAAAPVNVGIATTPLTVRIDLRREG